MVRSKSHLFSSEKSVKSFQKMAVNLNDDSNFLASLWLDAKKQRQLLKKDISKRKSLSTEEFQLCGGIPQKDKSSYCPYRQATFRERFLRVLLKDPKAAFKKTDVRKAAQAIAEFDPNWADTDNEDVDNNDGPWEIEEEEEEEEEENEEEKDEEAPHEEDGNDEENGDDDEFKPEAQNDDDDEADGEEGSDDDEEGSDDDEEGSDDDEEGSDDDEEGSDNEDGADKE
jgi:hypothetical protein